MNVPSRYPNMLRILKKHRKQMRIMEDYLFESRLLHEMEERIIEETGGTPIHLDMDSVRTHPTMPQIQTRSYARKCRLCDRKPPTDRRSSQLPRASSLGNRTQKS